MARYYVEYRGWLGYEIDATSIQEALDKAFALPHSEGEFYADDEPEVRDEQNNLVYP